jgi:hypothetical protein
VSPLFSKYRGVLTDDHSSERHKISGPPDSSRLSELIKDLRRAKVDIEAEANAVSIKQNHTLMQEVRKFMNQVTIGPKARLPCHIIAYPRNQRFSGRNDILQRMEDDLKPEVGKLKSYALHGLGGVGKTQLALHFAYTHTEVFKAIIWISARTPDKLRNGLIEAAQQLGLVGSDSSTEEKKAVDEFTSWLRSVKEPWLIVFDNADEVNILTQY